ncbi:KR domain-containing protein, partial [Amycolatopsis vancoresmycina]
GQGNYAAANAFLDAAAQRWNATGGPATALAWGYWARTSSLTRHLGDTDRGRIGRAGVRPLSTDAGMALFDAALASAEAALVPMDLDPAAVRAADEPVPSILRGLVRPVRPAAEAAAASAAGRTGRTSRCRRSCAGSSARYARPPRPPRHRRRGSPGRSASTAPPRPNRKAHSSTWCSAVSPRCWAMRTRPSWTRIRRSRSSGSTR